MSAPFRAPLTLLIGALLLAGCANDGSFLASSLTTASVPDTPRVDPVCVTLTSQIETLKKEGIAERVEKAAAKKYKMTPGDLVKADQLNKANADYQSKCSTLTPKTQTTAAALAPAPAKSAQ
jgi:hypothetical protein